MKVKKVRENAVIPTIAGPGDVGYDLYSLDRLMLFSNGVYKFKVGVAVEIPKGHFGLICDRGSMGAKGIKVMGGVIDEKFTGEIQVVLVNVGHFPYQVHKEDRIAQLLILPCYTQPTIEVEDLTETERGGKGFGSTGR